MDVDEVVLCSDTAVVLDRTGPGRSPRDQPCGHDCGNKRACDPPPSTDLSSRFTHGSLLLVRSDCCVALSMRNRRKRRRPYPRYAHAYPRYAHARARGSSALRPVLLATPLSADGSMGHDAERESPGIAEGINGARLARLQVAAAGSRRHQRRPTRTSPSGADTVHAFGAWLPHCRPAQGDPMANHIAA